MTQEDKELLLKDICARMPYGVKVNNEIQGDFNIYGICENIVFGRNEVCHIDFDVEKIKPYLFPLSSMTEEQIREQEAYFTCINHDMSFSICRYMEWCYKNHLDINGLIPKGLANDATGLNVY